MNQKIRDFCINPSVLKWARITIGYTIEVAAKKLEIETETLTKWEEGIDEPPIRKIRKFAHVYKRATTVFLLNFVPEENISPKFRKLLYDNINSFTSETLLAIRKAIAIQNIAKEALDLKTNQFLQNIKKLNSLSDYDQIALEIIRLLDLDEKAITKQKTVYEQLNLWKNAIEAQGIYIIEVGFSPEEAKGFAMYDDIAPVIVLNTNDHPKVRIFTLLHELSHFVFNTDAIDDQSTILNFHSTDRLEVNCNYLAGSILIPAKYLAQKLSALQLNPQSDIDTSIDVLTRVFNVSKQVILRRLYIQNYIQKDTFLRITKLLRESYGNGNQEETKKRGGNFYIKFMKNNSKAFIYDVLDAYRVNKIGYFDVLNFLNIKSSTLSKLEGRL